LSVGGVDHATNAGQNYAVHAMSETELFLPFHSLGVGSHQGENGEFGHHT
jgi:hypothetical protein